MTAPVFFLSPQAEEDLRAIANYIEVRSGSFRAEAVLDRISRALSAIAYVPNAGRRRTDLGVGLFTFPVSPWVVLYEPEAERAGIYVHAIYDGRRDLERLFRDYKRPTVRRPR